ncbi:MAG TPA: ATP-binding cassette domain-containing protein [Parasegetibacter sp.]
MKINLFETGKRFNREWIFRHLTFEFSSGNRYAITGPNGSGKSTLLQVIAGSMTASEGQVQYEFRGKLVENDDVYQLVSIAAPYLELIEEFTLTEFLRFHQTFKPLIKGYSIRDIIEKTGLAKSSHKQIRYFSSGMKQRVKLAQAMFSDTPVLLLDEPCTNFDQEGFALYHSLVQELCHGRLLIISSNDVQEYSICDSVIRVEDYRNSLKTPEA